MSLVALIVLLVVCGIGLWAINSYVPMDPKINRLLNFLIVAFLVIIVVIFLLQLLGINPGAHLRLT